LLGPPEESLCCSCLINYSKMFEPTKREFC